MATTSHVTISQAFLRDFDWKLNITVASDKLATLREPVLLLSLAIQGQDGKVQDINLELPASDLDKLLASLNGASDVVKQLKQL